MIESPPESYTEMLACEHNGLVYLTLGGTDDSYNDKMWAYDTGAKIWLRKADCPATDEGCSHIFHNIGNKLCLMADRDLYIYDIQTNQWSDYDQVYPSLAPYLGNELDAMYYKGLSFVSNNKVHVLGVQEELDELGSRSMLIIDFNKMEVVPIHLEKLSVTVCRGHVGHFCALRVRAGE